MATEFSKEAVVNANFARESGRPELVKSTGPIETALAEAKEKALFYRREAARTTAEADRWEATVAKLEEAYALVTGQAPHRPERKSATTIIGKKAQENQEAIREFMETHPVVLRTELRDWLKERGIGSGQQGASMVVNSAIKSGVLTEDGEYVKLADVPDAPENRVESVPSSVPAGD